MRNRAWLLAALALLGVAAWLMSRGDARPRKDRESHVVFPRYPRMDEQQRSARRRSLPALQLTPEDAGRPRDPVLTALPPARGKSAVVFEASALRTSPAGRMWLDCLVGKRDLEGLDRMKKATGVDMLQDVDRVAVSSEKVVVISGEFSGARWDALVRSDGGAGRAYGQKGTIYGGKLAVWGDGLLLLGLGGDETALHEAIDRLESSRAPETPPIPDAAMYGDIYGVLSAEDLADTLGNDQRGIADKLRRAVDQVELHVDASNDVAIVAHVTGPDGADVDDLGKSLGGALSLGRLEARAHGDEELGDLMDLARVRPEDGRFSLELALPLPTIEKLLGNCPRGRDAGASDAGP